MHDDYILIKFTEKITNEKNEKSNENWSKKNHKNPLIQIEIKSIRQQQNTQTQLRTIMMDEWNGMMTFHTNKQTK